MRALAVMLIAVGCVAQAGGWAEVSALFTARCTVCHSGAAAPNGLQLDSHETAISGGWMGPVLLAGNPDGSPLIRRLRGQIIPQMPLNGPPYLSEAEISMIADWILTGMPISDVSVALPSAPDRPAPGEPTIFAHVESIFLQRCVKCHSAQSIMGAPPEGLRLDSYANILLGGERLALLPGNPEMSEIWRRVVGLGHPRMPFDGPPWLEDDEIQLIYDWIAQGALNSDGQPAPVPVGRELRLRGQLTAANEIDGAVFAITESTRLDDVPIIGAAAEMRGVVMDDGSVRATRLRDR